MARVKGFILYKIYYENSLVYLGRTKQALQDRIRGHFFKKPMHRSIDINLVTKIEYAEFSTEADMYLYEIYYINTLKPPLNVDDKARDGITVTLPDVEFREFTTKLWDGWKEEINKQNANRQNKWDRHYDLSEELRILRSRHRMGEISESEFVARYDSISEENEELRKYLYGR
jgi:hypothetical protein